MAANRGAQPAPVTAPKRRTTRSGPPRGQPTEPETVSLNGSYRGPVERSHEHSRVTHVQRARMLAAMTEVVCERGASGVTVAHVVARAGVSRRTFYEQFDDCEGCFLAAFEDAVAQARRPMLDAWRAEASWTARVRAALGALLLFIDEAPFTARLLVVESLSGGPDVLRRRQELVAHLTVAVEEGRREARSGPGPAPLAAEGVVGGVLGVLHARLSEPGPPAGELAGPLMAMIVLPFLGAAASRRELERTVPRAAHGARPPDSNPLNGLHMRVTYRTIRVLAALAANPGSSNRGLAEASGIADQGQMSKLLGRLSKQGLVQNASAGGPSRGEPNAWTLTGEGWRVHGALARQLGD
jgi:AcrR family transcriptional regulator